MRTSAVAGIVFANIHDELMGNLTEHRSMAAVPFGGRYRLIDFPLSNLVNAGVSNIGLVTKEHYRSLFDHVGSGMFWDLDRKAGGLHLLPPYNTQNARLYSGYVEALHGALDFARNSYAEYTVLYDAETVANVDMRAAIEMHIGKQADVTVVTHFGKMPQNHSDTMSLNLGADDRVTEVSFSDQGIETDYSLGIIIMSTPLLIELVEKAYLNNCNQINREILAPLVSKLRIFAFRHQGFAAVMDGERTYYEATMQLLDPKVRADLFCKDRPILTKTRDDMPTRYGTKADVKNSLIADGCVIDGTVHNSVLFRGVHVAKGTVVENCILMQGTAVDAGAQLDRVVTDKNAVIGENMILKGTCQKSFFVKKNQTI